MSYERKKGVDSNDIDIVNGVEQIIPGQVSTKGVEIDTERVIRTDDLDKARFMADELIIHLGDAQSEHDPQIVEINVNGDYRMGVRGNEMKLKRSHLEVLAQAKQSRVRQRKVVNPDGSMGFVEETVLQLTYPFQVMQDPNPKKGAPWLRQLLSNPG